MPSVGTIARGREAGLAARIQEALSPFPPPARPERDPAGAVPRAKGLMNRGMVLFLPLFSLR